VSISEIQKSRAETLPRVSKTGRTRRRPVKAAMLHDHPFRVNATEFARRRFLRLAASAAAFPAVSRDASAQAYPARAVRIIVGFPPGSAADAVMRVMAQWLSERLRKPVIIENRPGAATNIAAQAAITSPPDGYTLVHIASSTAVNATLYRSLSFNFLRDTAPVAGIANFPQAMLVHPSVPAATVPEFIAYAKVNPGRISMASYGTGTVPHLAGELFKAMTGVDMVHVPYRGDGTEITDLISGRVQLLIAALTGSLVHIQSGALRALAVTADTRFDGLPDVPTVNEFVPGYVVTAVAGVAVPRGTPPEIIEKLNHEINAGLANPVIKARLAELVATPLPMAPAEFGAYMAAETEKWGKVVKTAGIRVD
jgi:tripartite-type tricarboxylate transporter receptor subunit TctC